MTKILKKNQLVVFALGAMLVSTAPNLLKADNTDIYVNVVNYTDYWIQFNVVYYGYSSSFNPCDKHWSDPVQIKKKGATGQKKETYNVGDSCSTPVVHIYVDEPSHQYTIPAINPSNLWGNDILTYGVYSDPKKCGKDKYCARLISQTRK